MSSTRLQTISKPPRILASLNFDLSVFPISHEGMSNTVDLEDYIWANKAEWGKELTAAIDKELSTQYGQNVYSEIKDIKRGSIELDILVILSAGYAVYTFISQYKDFSESIVLLRQHISSVVKRVTRAFLSSRLGEAASSEIRENSSGISIPFNIRLGLLRVKLSERAKRLSQISAATYLAMTNVILSITILYIIVKTFYFLSSISPLLVVTRSVPTNTIIGTILPYTPLPVLPGQIELPDSTHTSTLTPTQIPSATPTLASSETPTLTPSRTPTLVSSLTPTSTPSPTFTITSLPTPSATVVRQTPTPIPTPELAILVGDASVVTTAGVNLTLPAGTSVTILARSGCQVRVYWKDSSNQNSIEIEAWIDRALLGEGCS